MGSRLARAPSVFRFSSIPACFLSFSIVSISSLSVFHMGLSFRSQQSPSSFVYRKLLLRHHDHDHDPQFSPAPPSSYFGSHTSIYLSFFSRACVIPFSYSFFFSLISPIPAAAMALPSLWPTYIDRFVRREAAALATVASSIRYEEEGRSSLLFTRRASRSKPHQSILINTYNFDQRTPVALVLHV